MPLLVSNRDFLSKYCASIKNTVYVLAMTKRRFFSANIDCEDLLPPPFSITKFYNLLCEV